MSERTLNREQWYNKVPEVPDQPGKSTIKMTPKAKGELGTGFSKIATPAQPDSGHMQTKSERDSVGSRWNVGKQLHGKASPTTAGDCVKVKPNHEYHAK